MAENKWNKEIHAKIIAKAWKDNNFRNLLINNTKEALKEFGVELPKNTELKVLTEDANHLYFVLPQTPAEAKRLSTAELEQLAAASQKPYSATPWC